MQSAALLLEQTGCDAIMIGQGAMGSPWLFRQINAYLPDTQGCCRSQAFLTSVWPLCCATLTAPFNTRRAHRHDGGATMPPTTPRDCGAAPVPPPICQMSHFEELAKLAAEIIRRMQNDF